ncbi:MAG: PilZ domain-containing protein [Sumerlaeia bacterium]
MTARNEDNRRRYERLPIHLEVIAVLQGVKSRSGESLTSHGVAKDLSLGGMRIAVFREAKDWSWQITRGHRFLRIQTRIPDLGSPYGERVINLHGRIVWTKLKEADPARKVSAACEMGVEFEPFGGMDEKTFEFAYDALEAAGVETLERSRGIQGVPLR